MVKNLLWVPLLLALAATAPGTDWPAYRGDVTRSGVTPEKLSFPLKADWEYVPLQRPDPAWPEPGRHMHRMDYDFAFQPVIAGGLVYVPSSADDSIRALDAQSGAERWRYTVRGPVRFAPQIAEGRCYFAADDGYAYCLEAATGKLVWESRLALNERLFLGNDRMISRWPCRSGVLVAGGLVYATAGMWPSEGVYIYALDAATGQARWCNDTSASLYLPHPHASSSFGGVAPQGYLLLARDVLLVPTGQSSPAGLDPKTGKLLHCNIISGGSSVTVADNLFFSYQVKQTTEDHDILQLGENGPGDEDGLLALDLATGLMPNKGGMRFGLPGRENVLYHDHKLYAVGSGVVEALDISGAGERHRLWSTNQGRAYAMAIAGDVLLIGGAGEVHGISLADGQTVWQQTVHGEARGLAVAEGRLFVATEDGVVRSYAQAGRTSPGKPVAQTTRPAAASVDVSAVLRGVEHPEQMEGYALVIGAADASLAEALAGKTRLHVLCALPKAAAERERARMTGGALYGSRVAIYELGTSATLPFADYFANLVVVTGQETGVAASELYRVLHPCGGQLVYTGNDSACMAALKSAAPAEVEVIAGNGDLLATRGRLPGAFDWNSAVKCDERVKWPLEMLWFGGPGPSRMVARHWKAPTPVFANGRIFMIGQYHLMGVDAYNGHELWSRIVGGNTGYKTFKVSADDTRVYVSFTNYTAELDAASGRVVKLYGQPPVSPVQPLGSQSFVLGNKGTNYGRVELLREADGIEVVLHAGLPISSPKDSWQVHFDFRSRAEQFAGEERGLFRMLIEQTNGAWRAGFGGPVPKLEVKTEAGATRIRISTAALAGLLGKQPAAFQLAATLQRFPKGQPAARIHQFADGMATFLNEGWGTFVLEPPAAESADLLPVPVVALSELPAVARDWPRQPVQFTAEWTIDALDKVELPEWPPAQREFGPATRLAPFTGLQELLTYSKSHGCGGTIQSVATDFFRSGTIGIYDRVDDSGLRNIAAIRPGCGMTLMPAGGIVVSMEGQADCSCSFNFQTCLGLAPAARQRDEDWALHDAKTGAGLLQGAALNLGAPGDRRDTNGVLWLAYPRPAFPSTASTPTKASAKRVPDAPCQLEFLEGFGPERLNAERASIGGTDRPWIYASGARGLKKATLNLLLGEPQDCLAFETAKPPVMDGVLNDACWTDLAPLTLEDKRSSVRLRHDAENLYVAARLQKGAPPFALTLKRDADVAMARIAVDAQGKCHTARLDAALPVPLVGEMAIDGKLGDWGQSGVTLPLPGQGVCRLGWSAKGLVMSAHVPTNFSAGTDLTGFYILLFRPGSSGFLQCSIDAKAQTAALAHRIRKSPELPKIAINRNVSGLMHWSRPSGLVVPPSSGFQCESVKTQDGLVVETLFPWEDLCIEPGKGDLAFQIVFFDPTKDRDWRPQILTDTKNQGRLRFIEERAGKTVKTAVIPQRYGGFLAYEVQADDTWTAPCQAMARQENGGLTVEMAIPWKALAAAGIGKDELRAAFRDSDRWLGNSHEVLADFEKGACRLCWQKPANELRPYNVKLHFCELDGAQPGERMFDLKLQDKVVLENFDIAKAAGGGRVAIVKEFDGIMAGKELSVELVPKSGQLSERTAPLLNAIEVGAAE